MHSGTGTSFLQIVGVKLSTGNSKNCCPGGKLVVLHCLNLNSLVHVHMYSIKNTDTSRLLVLLYYYRQPVEESATLFQAGCLACLP